MASYVLNTHINIYTNEVSSYLYVPRKQTWLSLDGSVNGLGYVKIFFSYKIQDTLFHNPISEK